MTAAPVAGNPRLEAALTYAARGWHVFPLQGKVPFKGTHGLEDATTDPAVITAWWKRWPAANVGIRTGAISGLVGVDLDSAEAKAAWKQLRGDAPLETLAVKTGKGWHLYFTHPGGELHNTAGKLGPGIDTRGDGGYLVAPPSIHPDTGVAYTWLNDLPMAPAPAFVLKSMTKTEQGTPRAPIAGELDPYRQATLDSANGRVLTAPEGRRNHVLNTEAYGCAQLGIPQDLIEGSLARAARANGLDETEIRRTLGSAIPAGYADPRDPPPRPGLRVVREGETQPPEDDPAERKPTTDLGNAERLVEAHGEDLRYCDELGGWHVWDGTRWERDTTRAASRHAKTVVRAIANEGGKAYESWANRSEALSRIQAMLTLAQFHEPIAARPDVFDRDPWALNTMSGTLDLHTGQLRPWAREDMLTKRTPIAYDADARSDLWERFLHDAFLGDQAMISFAQRAAGYSLTGDTTEECLFLLHGIGSNGKSTLVESIAAALGDDYAGQTPTDTLISRRPDQPSADLAKLRGARFISAIESEEGQKLSESIVKQLTGGDRVTARFLHQNFFTFTPELKLWLATNHLPTVRGTDEGIWRRLRLIPFLAHFPEDTRDKAIKEQLKTTESAAVLAWCVQGCLAWQAEGLGTPETVKRATAGYRADQDVLAGFLEDRCIIGAGFTVTASHLYKTYQLWCLGNGEQPVSQTRLGRTLTERGFQRSPTKANRYYIGIGVTDATNPENVPNASPTRHQDPEGDASGDAMTRCDTSLQVLKPHARAYEGENTKQGSNASSRHQDPDDEPELL